MSTLLWATDQRMSKPYSAKLIYVYPPSLHSKVVILNCAGLSQPCKNIFLSFLSIERVHDTILTVLDFSINLIHKSVQFCNTVNKKLEARTALKKAEQKLIPSIYFTRYHFKNLARIDRSPKNI